MQLFKDSDRGLDGILHKVGNKVKGSFRNFKDKVNESLKYLLDERLLGEIKNNAYYGLQKVKDGISEYGTIIKDKIKRLSEYSYEKLEKIVYKTMEYVPKIAFSALPSPARVSISEGLYIINADKSLRGRLIGSGLIVVGIATTVGLYLMFELHPIHPLPSNNEHLVGYIGFEPNGQTINYNGHIDPVGTLISNNGTIIDNAILDNRQYANTIIQNHNQIVQLNSQFVGQTDPINGQPYVPQQDVYVIDANNSQVLIQQTTIDGQTYYVIDANNINPANIAGFYTYQGWVPNFVEAMNTPGTYAAGLPGNSPVFQWENLTGTVAYQTWIYQDYIRGAAGRYVLVLPNKTIIPYGASTPAGSAIPFDFPQQSYNPSS